MPACSPSWPITNGAVEHTPVTPEQIDAPGLWRGVAFRVGQRKLASMFGEVGGIITLPVLTPVPGGQPWLLGVANIRGNLLPVVDLKLFMEGERTVLHENQRSLVIRQPGGNVAVLLKRQQQGMYMDYLNQISGSYRVHWSDEEVRAIQEPDILRRLRSETNDLIKDRFKI